MPHVSTVERRPPQECDGIVREVMRRLFRGENCLRAHLGDFTEPRWKVCVGIKGAALMFGTESADVIFTRLTEEERSFTSKESGTFGPYYRVVCEGAFPQDVRTVMEVVVLVALEDLMVQEAMERLADNPHLAELGELGLQQLAFGGD